MIVNDRSLARPSPRAAVFAVVVLTAMNLLNYIDRWVPSAVKEPLKKDLDLSDGQTGFLLTAFVWVYMLASPLFGSLAERVSRKVLIAGGVAVWSVASASAALCHDFPSLLAARGAVGVGEAAYATIAPALLADYFPAERRNRIFTIFYLATPVGSAIGFILGGQLEAAYDWRAAFLICGLPGLAVALLALFIKEPPRGQFDLDKSPAPGWGEALQRLTKNRLYVCVVLGYTAVTFATGAVTDWFVTYLLRNRGFKLEDADALIGKAAVIGGLVGTITGGFLADRLKGRTRHPYLAVSALSLIPAAILVSVAIYVAHEATAISASIVVGMIFFMMYNAPINAMIVNSVDAGLRTRAFGLSILSIHLFGDAASPYLVGKLSDATGGNLALALGIAPLTILVGCAVWLWGWRRLPEESAARAVPN
jgi:MFS family permease